MWILGLKGLIRTPRYNGQFAFSLGYVASFWATKSLHATSFPGSLSYPSRDPGWVWSRVSQNLGDYKQTTWGRGG